MLEKYLPSEKPEILLQNELLSAFTKFPEVQKDCDQILKPIYDPELRSTCIKETNRLIEQSLLTSSVRKLYEKPIEDALDNGIDKENLENEELYKLFGFDLPIPGGIYNPFNVIQITRRIISNRIQKAVKKIEINTQSEIDYELLAALAELE